MSRVERLTLIHFILCSILKYFLGQSDLSPILRFYLVETDVIVSMTTVNFLNLALGPVTKMSPGTL